MSFLLQTTIIRRKPGLRIDSCAIQLGQLRVLITPNMLPKAVVRALMIDLLPDDHTDDDFATWIAKNPADYEGLLAMIRIAEPQTGASSNAVRIVQMQRCGSVGLFEEGQGERQRRRLNDLRRNLTRVTNLGLSAAQRGDSFNFAHDWDLQRRQVTGVGNSVRSTTHQHRAAS